MDCDYFSIEKKPIILGLSVKEEVCKNKNLLKSDLTKTTYKTKINGYAIEEICVKLSKGYCDKCKLK